MFRQIKLLLLVIGAILTVTGLAADGGEVLWWLIDTDFESLTATMGDSTITAGELGVTDVRIRYQSDDGSSIGYLTLISVNDDGSVSIHDGSMNIGADHGAGLPAEYFGDLSALSDTAYSFVVELGNWENGKWAKTSMESEPESYHSLAANKHITNWDETSPSFGTPWTPTSFHATVVPEPSSALMTLLGIAALALRRKRRS